MADLASDLRASLDSMYEIEREVGRGGMAIVYAAQDIKHRRRVALKVLRPELAASIAADRFLREIGIAARLNHPHILPLYDSGRAGAHVYFVAPFAEGESLRQRLDREHRLDVPSAMAIARDVASALAYSHAHGVIHRDIKPENTLLNGSEAIVADFGIAHAIEEAGSQRLTNTGWAVGTAMYLAPEQALGVVDPRSDIYSLGCMMYEMLAGEPPFRGGTAGETVGMHLRNKVPSLAARRADLPDDIVDVVMRALEKDPGDRFASADELLTALGTVSGSISAGTMRLPRRVRRRRLIIAASAAVAVSLAGAAVLYPSRTPDLRRGTIAIFPFSVRGVVDTSLVSSNALMELLALRLPGDVGPRAVDPQLVVHSLGEARPGLTDVAGLQRIAQSLGAPAMLVGSATGTREGLELSGIVYDTRTGKPLGPVSATGSRDSVMGLIDQLSASLLMKLANVKSARVAAPTKNVPAFRHYLAGLDNFRRGRYREAGTYLDEALRLDSTFALAALRRSIAQQMTDGTSSWSALTTAWAHRDRLAPHERLYLSLLLGPNGLRGSSYRAETRAWTLVIDTIPERWEAAWIYGDLIFHEGAASDNEGSLGVAKNMFTRALEVDSAHAPALEHLLQVAIIERDTTKARAVARRFFTADSLADNGPVVRWMMASFTGDTAKLRRARGEFPALTLAQLSRIAASSQLFPLDADSALSAAEEAVRHTTTPVEQYLAKKDIRELLLNAGRPAEADRRGPKMAAPYTFVVEPFLRSIEAQFWGGDSLLASRLVAERKAKVKLPARVDTTMSALMMDVCAVGLWTMRTGNARRLDSLVRTLRAYPSPYDENGTHFVPLCAATIDAHVAAREHRTNATVALDHLDSLVRENWVTNGHIRLAARMTLAELVAAQGDYTRALRAVRRRSFTADTKGIAGLSTLLRAEGQLAAQVGDTVGARRAYEHYLALRTRPEPSVRGEVEAVRAKLRALEKRER